MNPTGTSIYNDPSLAAARTAAQTATQTAASESAASISLPNQLRAALNAKFSTDNPIYADREGAIKDYFNATTQAPLNVTAKSAGGNSDVIYNPAQQANLIQQYRSPSIAHLATLNDLLNLSTGGIENIIGATSRADQGAVAGMNADAQTKNQTYQNILTELSKKAEEAYQNKSLQQQLQIAELSRSTNPLIIKNSTLQSIAQDAQSGMTLKDIMGKYSTQSVVDPTEILQVYNKNSKWGVATESPLDLQNLYGVKPTLTTEQLNRIGSLAPAEQAIKQAMAQDYTQTGPQAKGSQFAIQYLGGLGVPQSLVSQNQNFELLRQQVVRAMQGARISDADIRIAQGFIPNIGDTPETIKTKLNNLNSFISGQIGMGTSNSSDSGWQ